MVDAVEEIYKIDSWPAFFSAPIKVEVGRVSFWESQIPRDVVYLIRRDGNYFERMLSL